MAVLTRRNFLIGSAVVVGGVVFGVRHQIKKEYPNPLLAHLNEGEAAITPYVFLSDKGVTLITPRADIGQGATSIQAYLLAEELDVNLEAVTFSPGLPDPAYYNGAVMGEGFPFASTDESKMAQRMRSVGETIGKIMGLQITGGSSTVPDSYEKLRLAGAVARETIKEAAAQRFGVPRSALTTENGFVINGSQRIAYEDLVAELASIAPVDDVELRSDAQWKHLGKPVQRIDVVGRSTGTEVYGLDMVMDDMMYASVRTNPGIGAPVGAYDATKAKALPGVHKIIPITNGVAVVANNTWRAIKAVNAVDIEWDRPNYLATSEAMWQSLSESFNEDQQDSQFKNEGDVELALEGARVFTAEYKVPALAHGALEPMNATVLYTGERIDIWTGTQIPGIIKQHASMLSGLDEEHVFVHVLPSGGSFGRRLEDTYVMQAVEVALAMKGVPVKMTWSREEDFAHDYPRPKVMARGRGAIKNGKIDSYDLGIASDSVVASWMGDRMGLPMAGPDTSIVAGAWDQPFSIPNYRVTGYKGKTGLPISSWRSVGASANGFFHDSFLDELIHEAGLDPLQARMDLCTHDVSRKVLETVGQLANWNGHKPAANKGRGVGFCIAFGVPTAEIVDVTYTEQGIHIDDVYVVADVGKVLDPINLEAQLMGGAIFGLAHAMNCELTYKDYKPTQTNFHAYQGMRMYQTPKVHVKALANAEKIRGAGEPGVPPAAPALANAIFAATGQRYRELPLSKQVKFV